MQVWHALQMLEASGVKAVVWAELASLVVTVAAGVWVAVALAERSDRFHRDVRAQLQEIKQLQQMFRQEMQEMRQEMREGKQENLQQETKAQRHQELMAKLDQVLAAYTHGKR